jgi:hypothetical protein
MLSLVVSEGHVFKFDDQTGHTWMLKEDEDERPVWVEICDQKDEKEK